MSDHGVKAPRVCVAMIVKNEGHVIERCLAAARPYFDTWAIVDTGSTDDTLSAIARATEGWEGRLGHVVWTGFGDARTESLRLAAETGADYAFVIDADEIFTPDEGFSWPTDRRDIYNIMMNLGGMAWPQSRLFRLARGWRYEGVLHEGPTCPTTKPCGCPDPVTGGMLTTVKLVSPRDGARSKNPNKYRDDALVLEEAVAKDPTNSRYVFYTAQSWRDAKDDEKAIEWYTRRVKMGEASHGAEVYMSLFEIARAKHRLERPIEEVRAAYLSAHSLDPTRAEPLFWCAALHRERKDFPLAWLFASMAVTKKMPESSLFIDTRIYRWLAKDELAIGFANVGRPDVAIQLYGEILAMPDLPEPERERLKRNLEAFKKAQVVDAPVNEAA